MIYQPDYQGRLDWAGQHLQRLESEVKRWKEGNPCRVWTELDLQTGQNLIWAEVLRPPPNKIGFIIGDCLYNLRSALDNLVYELGVAYQKGPLSKSMASDSQFPIFRHESHFLSKGKDMIRGIHPDAQTFIEGLQPYNREGENNTLLVLNKLATTDRHQLPHMTVVMPEEVPYFTTDISGIPGLTTYWEPFEGRAIIAEYPHATQPYTEMDMQRPPTFTVAFGKRAPDVIQGWGVRAIVRQIYDYITRKVTPTLIGYLA